MARLGVDVGVAEEWRGTDPELVAIFVDFLRRCGVPSQAATTVWCPRPECAIAMSSCPPDRSDAHFPYIRSGTVADCR